MAVKVATSSAPILDPSRVPHAGKRDGERPAGARVCERRVEEGKPPSGSFLDSIREFLGLGLFVLGLGFLVEILLGFS